jgi:hypothetical protein
VFRPTFLRFSIFVACISAFAGGILAFAPGALPVQAPVQNSTLWVRLLTPVSSKHAANQAVQAVVTRPYSDSSGAAIPMGSRVTGTASAPARGNPARLVLHFNSVSIHGQQVPFSARILEVDNARERVDSDGTIVGLDLLKKRPGKVEVLLLLAAHAHPIALASVETAKLVLREVEKPEVSYPAGTDIVLSVEKQPGKSPVIMPAPESAQGQQKHDQNIDAATAEPLARLLLALPVRTTAKHLSLPSDWINMAFIGSRQSLEEAFRAAGWETAAQLSLRTEARTFFAIAERHAYQSAPVSTLMISGREPDLVYQRQTNTFAKRHHIRIWSSDQVWQGSPVWIAAATHDVGIDFSTEARTFTHQVESNVDLERTKVISDLRFSGRVADLSYVARPSVAGTSKNATGDVILTDGRLAVLSLTP